MTKHLLAGMAAVGLISGVALAQTYPPAPPPPPGAIVTPAVPVAPVPVPVPGGTSTTTTVTPNKEVDKKGNTIIEKDIHREGIAGSTETHTNTETDRDGTVTHSETTTKHD
jgi:hypothetical protein